MTHYWDVRQVEERRRHGSQMAVHPPVETVRLRGNRCPKHPKAGFILLGEPEGILMDADGIVVPKHPSDRWAWGHGGPESGYGAFNALFLKCEECHRLTVHRWLYPSPIAQCPEWRTTVPDGWRSRVQFGWSAAYPREVRVWNATVARVLSRRGVPLESVLLLVPGSAWIGGAQAPNIEERFLNPTLNLWRHYVDPSETLRRFRRHLRETEAHIGRLLPELHLKVRGLFTVTCAARQAIYDSRRTSTSPSLAAARSELERELEAMGFYLPPLREEPPPKPEESAPPSDSSPDGEEKVLAEALQGSGCGVVAQPSGVQSGT